MDDPLVLFDEVLSPKHRSKVEGFKCSKEKEVEVFLKKDAWELQDCNMAVTRLFFNKNEELVGYFTLFNVSLPKMNKEKIKKKNGISLILKSFTQRYNCIFSVSTSDILNKA